MRIFLSYPHKDTSKAQQLQAVLTQGGHEVWTDAEIIAGQNWREQLEAEIQRTDAIALALTPNWLASPICQWEFVTAVENSKKVIPVLLSAGMSLPNRLSRYQYADLSRGFDRATVQKLLDDLVTLATTVEPSAIAGMDKAAYAQQVDHESVGIIGDGNVVTRTGEISINGGVIGTNVAIGSSQIVQGDMTFNVGAIPARQDVRAQLATLVEQLKVALANIPAEKAEEIEALAQDAVDEANKDRPNKYLLKTKGNSLKQATENLRAATPIAEKIAATLLRLE